MSATDKSTTGNRTTARWAIDRWSRKHPRGVVAMASLVVLAMAPGILRLEIRTDGNALVPQFAEAVRFDHRVREQFGLQDPLAVVIRTAHADGIFNQGTLSLVKSLTESFATLEHVRPHDISSLSTEHSHRVKEGTLQFRRFLDPLPLTCSEQETLREDLRQIRLYSGTLVSRDEQATAILVGTPSRWDRVAFYHELRAIVNRVAKRERCDDRIEVIGAPAAEALLGHHLLDDLGVPEAILGGQISDTEESFGAVPTRERIRRWVTRHIGLVPVAIVLMAFVFAVSFRNVPAVLLPLAEVGASIVFVFGTMGYLGVPLYLTIAVLPVILTAIGIADEIHIYTHFREEVRDEDRSLDEVVSRTMDVMRTPVVQTSLTTAIGFLSFSLSPLGPVRAFGLLTAWGVMFCMLWSLVVVPALLMLFPRTWHRRAAGASVGGKGGMRLSSWLGALARGSMALRWPVVLIGFAFVALAPAAVRRVNVQDSWINGFATTSGFYQATTAFNRDFLGTHLLLLVLETDDWSLEGELGIDDAGHHELYLPGDAVDDPAALVDMHLRFRIPFPEPRILSDGRKLEAQERVCWIEQAEREGDRIKVTLPRRAGSPKIAMNSLGAAKLEYHISLRRFLNPDVIREAGYLTGYVRGLDQYSVGGALGPAEYVETTNLMSRGLKEESRVIPDDRKRILWLWEQYGRIRGEARLQQLVSSEFDAAVVTVFLKDANFQDTARLMDSLEDYAAGHLESNGIRMRFAGDVAVSQTLIGAIVTTQVQSLLISLVGVMIVASLLGRSVLFGILAVTPCALAVLGNFALMGLTGMPLGVATSMFAGMTLGIGVDFAVHTLARYRRERAAGADTKQAVVTSMTMVGPAIVIDACAVAIGYGVLTLSQVPANARLGALVVFSLAGCLLATLFVLPALLRVIDEKRTRNPSPPEAGVRIEP